MNNLNRTEQKNGKKIFQIEEINEYANENAKELVRLCEENYRSQIDHIADEIVKNKSCLVFIAGPSSSGKTTTSSIISEALLKRNVSSLVVSIDNFFLDLEDTPLLSSGEPDFESISAVDTATFTKFCNDILTTRKAKMPTFSFTKHRRDGWMEVELNEGDVVIFEGIHALNPELFSSQKFESEIYRVYACVDSVFSYNGKVVLDERELRLIRRINRDTFTRGRNAINTIGLWKNVCHGEDANIRPYKNLANTIIDTTHAYEVLIYANYLPKLLEPYKNNATAKKLLTSLSYCKKLSKSLVPNESVLWEFLVEKE